MKNAYDLPVAYEGKEPYAFVSYAHKDAPTVLPIIEALTARGFRIWYDAGIEAGTEWPDYIAEHLESAALVLAFLSPASVASVNCRQEINYAIDLTKPMLTVYLEQLELTGGMRMRLGLSQAMFYYRHATADSFIGEISCSELLSPCLNKAERAAAGKGEKTDTESKTKKTAVAPTAKKTVPTAAEKETPAPTPKKTAAPLTLCNAEFNIKDGELYRYLGQSAEVTIPDGVTVIGSEAFKNNQTVTRVILPDSVTLMRGWAFANCPSLQKVTLSKNLEGIASTAFCGCPALASIEIPEGVRFIGRMAFKECTALASVSFPSSLEEIGAEAFRACKSLSEIRLPAALKTVEEMAFSGCAKLKRVSLSPSTDYVREGKKSFPASAKLLF